MSTECCVGDLILGRHQAIKDNDPVEADRLRCLFLKAVEKRLNSLLRMHVMEALVEMRMKSAHRKR